MPISLFRNTTYCSKVAFPLEVVQKDSCFNSSMKLPLHKLYIEYGVQKITCPNVDGFFPSTVKPTITWYMVSKLESILPSLKWLSLMVELMLKLRFFSSDF